MIIRFAFLSVAMAAAVPAFGQLHLITGSPTPNYLNGFESALLRVGADGGVARIATLVSEESGTEWIGTSEDWRKAVLLPRDGGLYDRVVVVDFDKAVVVKDCRAGGPRPFTYNEWLWDSPTKGHLLAEYIGGEKPGNRVVVGMLLDPDIPCDKTFTNPDKGDIRYVLASGTAGVSDVDRGPNMRVWISSDGKVMYSFLDGSVYFDFQIPSAMMDGISRPASVVAVSSRALFAINLCDFSDPEKGRLLVLRRADNTWHRVPVNTGQLGLVRGFGTFLAIVDYQRKSDKMPGSAGSAEWRTKDSVTGPDMKSRFDNDDFGYAYPGRLYLYDAAAERTYTILTNQGDSEILLVEDNVVYYRASDRLYSAPITKTGLGAAKLLATSDLIRDAHWAFIKR